MHNCTYVHMYIYRYDVMFPRALKKYSSLLLDSYQYMIILALTKTK